MSIIQKFRKAMGFALGAGMALGVSVVLYVHGPHTESYKIAFLFLSLVAFSNLLAKMLLPFYEAYE